MNYEGLYASKGSAYRQSQLKPNTYYNVKVDKSPGRPAGNSRISGDASHEVQQQVMDAIVEKAKEYGLDQRETAHALAIAREESGFNPDAAAGTTSASGFGQLIDDKASRYGVQEKDYVVSDYDQATSKRFDIPTNADAFIRLYII